MLTQALWLHQPVGLSWTFLVRTKRVIKGWCTTITSESRASIILPNTFLWRNTKIWKYGCYIRPKQKQSALVAKTECLQWENLISPLSPCCAPHRCDFCHSHSNLTPPAFHDSHCAGQKKSLETSFPMKNNLYAVSLQGDMEEEMRFHSGIKPFHPCIVNAHTQFCSVILLSNDTLCFNTEKPGS